MAARLSPTVRTIGLEASMELTCTGISLRVAALSRRALLCAAPAMLILVLPAASASASRIPRVPPPPQVAHRAPSGVHVHRRSLRVIPARRGRRHAAAQAASLPPVTSLATWRTGLAACDAWYLNASGLTSAGVQVTPPVLQEVPISPGGGWLTFYYRAGVTWWDPVRNQWIQTDAPWAWQQTNPINAFDYQFGPYIPSGVWPMIRHRMYSYVWVEAWWHYTSTYDEASSGAGGNWYTGTHYLRQVGSAMSNGACWYA